MSNRFISGLTLLNLQLSPIIIVKELQFIDEMLRWNQQVNLTSIRNRDEAIEKHLLDSLLIMPYLSATEQILDMGSGGGLPGIPLAIAMSKIKVVSIDSVGKKINFQKHIKRILQLDNLEIQQSRVENLRQRDFSTKKFDLVIARAFSSLDVLLNYAAPLLKSGGRLLAMKGPEGRNELKAVERSIVQLHFLDPIVHDYRLPFTHAKRQLIILKKESSDYNQLK